VKVEMGEGEKGRGSCSLGAWCLSMCVCLHGEGQWLYRGASAKRHKHVVPLWGACLCVCVCWMTVIHRGASAKRHTIWYHKMCSVWEK
jgi:hypothetical protein